MLANDRASEDSSRCPRAGSNQDRRDGAERLEAIVVTGQATGVEKKNLANAVAEPRNDVQKILTVKASLRCF